MSTKVIGVLLIISITIFSFDSICNKFSRPIVKGIIDDPVLTETSGLVSSIRNKGFLWAHNDSGDLPKLYLLDSTGHINKIFDINGAAHFDWEDIGIQYDSATGNSYLYVGDIGDNLGILPFRTIYKIEEPHRSASNRLTITEKMHYKYPDGPRDAETLMVSPYDGTIHIITKREKQVHYYQSEFRPFKNEHDTVRVELKGKLKYHNIVAGDISPDGNHLLLKTYAHVYYWNTDQNLFNVLRDQKPVTVNCYIEKPQGESICWDIATNGFYTLSEKKGKDNPKVYFYPAN